MIYIIMGVLGLIIGSFLNVVVLRMDEIETIVNTRSHCPKCRKDLAWYDLIPLISFVLLRGKCRYCKKSISWQYPIVEFVTGALFTFAYYFTWSQPMAEGWKIANLAFYLIMIAFLVVLFMYDLLESLVPDEIVLPAVGITLVFQLVSIYFNPDYKITLMGLVLGGVIGAGVPALLSIPSQGKWMGYGDIAIGALLGLLLGFPAVILGMFVAFASGGLVGSILLLMKKKKLTSAIPFGPFLVTGVLVGLFWGEAIIRWYLSFFMIMY